MNQRLSVIGMLFAAVMSVLPGASSAETLVSVAGENISSEEFGSYLKGLRKTQDLVQFTETLTAEGKEKLLRNVVKRKTLAALARNKGIDRKQAVREALAAAYEAILEQALLDEATSAADVGEKSLHDYYNAHPDLFRTERRVRARHVVTKTAREAEDAVRRIKGGEEFVKVAAQINADTTRSTGGDLGWIVKGLMVKQFEEAVYALKAGGVSDIVKTSYGFHIIKAEEVEEPRLKPFDSVREDVAAAIRRQKVSDVIEESMRMHPPSFAPEYGRILNGIQ